jgi:uncharacterized protein HemY
MLGRRDAALRALVELLSFEPQHLPSLALLAELHLVDERWEQAADALRAVSLAQMLDDAPRPQPISTAGGAKRIDARLARA